AASFAALVPLRIYPSESVPAQEPCKAAAPAEGMGRRAGTLSGQTAPREHAPEPTAKIYPEFMLTALTFNRISV
ncbi:hypothetical protein, partial [Eisenbergiella tayi]|uniref:hypothetical protein n=1 Tax=Eisenbergiella tayi TaxID=1432052 RepID=UPI002A818672